RLHKALQDQSLRSGYRLRDRMRKREDRGQAVDLVGDRAGWVAIDQRQQRAGALNIRNGVNHFVDVELHAPLGSSAFSGSFDFGSLITNSRPPLLKYASRFFASISLKAVVGFARISTVALAGMVEVIARFSVSTV